MKNNDGVTLVALVVIIVLLIIFTSAAIYTSVKSYELIDLQKYKAQMQSIQSAVDEFYEEFENEYTKNESDLSSQLKNNEGNIIGPIEKKDFLHYFIQYKQTDETNSVMDYIKGVTDTENFGNIKNYQKMKEEESNYTKQFEWWNNVAPNYGISIGEEETLQQYYYLTKDDIKKVLDIDNIDVSDGFIINFKERYIFSDTYIEITRETPDVSGNDKQKIYCLYEINEEEKAIKFEAKNTSGTLKIDVIEQTLYYKKIRIKLNGSESIIKQLYFNNDNFTNKDTLEKDLIVENKKGIFSEVTGIGTNTVEFKIISEGSYSFWAKDVYDGLYVGGLDKIEVVFHQPPVLDDNMIPFTAVDNSKGKVFYNDGKNNLNDWYDYSKPVVNIKYATVVIANLNQSGKNLNDYNKENAGKEFSITQNTTYTEGTTHIVKVWVPKKLAMNILGEDYYNAQDFINKTGIWVTAEWNGSKWVPAGNYQINAEITNFSKTQLNITCSSTDRTNLKYFWKINNIETYPTANVSTDGQITIGATNNIKDEIKSVTIYAKDNIGNSSKVKTINLEYEDISSAEVNLLKDGGFETTGTWKISCTGGNEDASLSYDTTIKRTGNSSLKLIKSKAHGEIAAEHSTQINVNYNHTYYFSAHSYQITNTETYKTIEIFFPIVGGYSDSIRINKTIGNWQRHSWICKTRSYSSTQIGFRLDYDSPASSSTSTIYYDDAMLIDLDKLQEYINTKQINVTVSKNKEWCDAHIDTYDGKTILLYEK